MTPEKQSIHLVGRLAKLERELAVLREIFPKILDALGNGSGCLPSCSVEFMQWIPNEVRLVVNGLKRELEQKRQDRKQAELDVCRALGERNDARKELDRERQLSDRLGICLDDLQYEHDPMKARGAFKEWQESRTPSGYNPSPIER